jgi:hypothetical protein
MSLIGVRPLRWLFTLVFSVLLIGSMDLSIDQQTEGGAPFFNNSGSLNLPSESIVEMQESMPELMPFRAKDPSQILPPLGNPLESAEG